MACVAPCMTPPKRRLRRLGAQVSNESDITDMCISPPQEKRRRLTLLFKNRNVNEEAADLKKTSPQVAEAEAEKWENTSTVAPDSDSSTPKTTTSGTVTPQSRLIEGDRDSEGEEDAFLVEPAAAGSMLVPGSFVDKPELAVLSVCANARNLVRASRANKSLSEEAALRAQVLACYFVQVNASTTPMPQLLGDCDNVVAEVAAKTACAACSADSAEEQPLRLPLDFLDGVVEGLVKRLPRSEAFRTHFAARRGESPQIAACSLASGLLQVARQFVADSFLSADVALHLSPRVVAAAAVALAATFELRRCGAEVPSEELFTFLAMEAGSLKQLKHAATEIMGVFRLWKDLQQRCDVEQKVENSN